MSKHIQSTLRAGFLLLLLVAAGCIAVYLRRAWPQLQCLQLRVWPVVLALACAGAALGLHAVLWRTILKRIGTELPFADAVGIWFISQLVRYVPGNIWQIVGRTYLGVQEGARVQPLARSMVYEMIQGVTTALIVGGLSLLFWSKRLGWGACTIMIPVLLSVYTWPQLLQRPIRWLLTRLNVPCETREFTRGDFYVLLPWYCVVWLAYGCGAFFLLKGIYPVGYEQLPMVAGMFALAWVAGFVSFITPSGLGVREGVLAYLFSTFLPTPVAVVAALLARIWLIVAEVVCALLAVGLRGRV